MTPPSPLPSPLPTAIPSPLPPPPPSPLPSPDPAPWVRLSAFVGTPWLPGSLYRIGWEYGVSGVDIELDLYKDGSYKRTIAIGLSSADLSYIWEVPNGLGHGTGYTIVMIATSTGVAGESEEFSLAEAIESDDTDESSTGAFGTDGVVYAVVGRAGCTSLLGGGPK